EGVRSAPNQFVFLLHCDRRAPVRPEMQTRPDSKCTPGCSQAKAYPAEPRLWRKPPGAKDPNVQGLSKQKGKGRGNQSQMKYPGRSWLRSGRLLPTACLDKPINSNGNPDQPDPFQRIHIHSTNSFRTDCNVYDASYTT